MIQCFWQCISSGIFTYDQRFQVHKNSSWDVFSSTSLTKEGGERIISSSNGSVRRHLPIWFNPMLQAIQFPAWIADLDTSLTNMDGDALTLSKKKVGVNRVKIISLINYSYKETLQIILKRTASSCMCVDCILVSFVLNNHVKTFCTHHFTLGT